MRFTVFAIFIALFSLQIHAIRGQVKDIIETAQSYTNLTTLVTAITSAGLVDTLKGTGPFTVFAPSDAAFNKLPAGVLEALIQPINNSTLNRILQYHVTNGNLTSTSINPPTNVTMLAGGITLITKKDSVLMINNAIILTTDIIASNGIIHIIDSVILPPLDIVETALINGNFKTLLTALQAADLLSTLKGSGPFTVLAPSDAAFAKLPPGTIDDLLKPENKEKLANILKYHVIGKRITSVDILAMNLPAQVETLSSLQPIVDKDGNTVKVNGATVVTADVGSTNGIIHVIDTVLLPPTDIVQTASNTTSFSTLVTALTAADLTNTLKGPGPFTVFAPNNDAFNKLPPGVVAELVKPENTATLTSILKYHVVEQLITGASLNRMTLPANITTLQGTSASVTKVGAVFKVNDVSITQTDIFNTNGMIHVVDSVLLPPLDIVERALLSGNFKTLITALKAADLVSTLKGNGPFTVFAPNDDAFNKLPNGTVTDWLKPENKNILANILKYHTVNGRKILSTDINPGENLQMMGGGSTKFSKDGTTLKINDASIIQADSQATNGVMHVIDKVLTPEKNSGYKLFTNNFFIVILVSILFLFHN